MHDCYPCPPFWGYPIASCLDHLFPLNTFSLWIISAFCMGCLYQYKQETQHFSYNFFLFSPYQDPLTQGCVCGCGCVCMCVLKTKKAYNTNSVQFSHSVMSDSLQPHELQHTRPPCSSPNPGVHSNSCLSSRWCHPAISSSVVPFSSCLQSFPASGSFLRILEQVALSSPRGSSWARDRMCLLHCRWILYHWVTCEAPFRE